MGTFIIKTDRDVDFYVLWSDNTEEPAAWGTRTEVLDILHDANHSSTVLERLERMARADETGTSNRLGIGRWDDEDLIYRQQGLLPRTNLRALCELYAAHGFTDLTRAQPVHLLRPFEDDDPAEWLARQTDERTGDYRQEER